MTSTSIIWSNIQCIECSRFDLLLLDCTSYTNTSSPIIHNGVLNFFPRIICLGDITECTPVLLLNELISTVAHFVISIVSLFGYILNGVSYCIDLTLFFTNLIAFSALGTCESAAHVVRSMCNSFLIQSIR